MSMEPAPLTLTDAASRAVKAVNSLKADAGIGDFLERFEDADGPIGDAGVAEQQIAEEVGAIDPQAEDAAIQLAAAVTTYLVYRRDEAAETDDKALVQLAARAEYKGEVPEPMAGWLTEVGIDVH